MKPPYIIFLFIVFVISATVGNAQQAGDLKERLKNAQHDTNRVNLLLQLAEFYYFNKPDSCLVLADEAVELAHQLNFTSGELNALNVSGEALRFLGKFPEALEIQFRALDINRNNNDEEGEAISLSFIGFTYIEFKEYRQGLNYLYQAKKIFENYTTPVRSTFNLSNIGNAYEGMNMLDSALFFQQQALAKSAEFTHGNLKLLILTRLGIVFARQNKNEEALKYYYKALQEAYIINDKVNPGKIQDRIAQSYLVLNKKDSSFYYARLSFASSQQISQKLQILDASNMLVKLFRDNNMPDSVIHYQDIAIAMNDSLFGPEKFRQLQLLTLGQQQRQQQILQQQERYQNKMRTVALLIMLGLFFIIAVLLYNNNRHKQKVNVLLEDQKNEIQNNLMELKSTQSQLVQREKMASLGELTAGIAHEIQNPLNFVNNFSEVNKEMLEELKVERLKPKAERDDDLQNSIINDLTDNEEKINHHGKRADSIVKGMLEHSRTSTGKKEPTDINKLADEYLRLSYHGLRAKDKSFNTEIKTEFDEAIGKINLVPQDIGRVLLNLFNNAFYAVNEKKQKLNGTFGPTVFVSTKKENGNVIISVADNGNGIPQKVVDKIFQPFFTTKPTGQGTGLGLSLSYDIIKAHGGEIKVETKEGEGTAFIIQLPII